MPPHGGATQGGPPNQRTSRRRNGAGMTSRSERLKGCGHGCASRQPGADRSCRLRHPSDHPRHKHRRDQGGDVGRSRRAARPRNCVHRNELRRARHPRRARRPSVAPGVVSDRRAAIAGALGYAISNVLGFGVVTGGALRYRIYSAEGLDAADVLRVTTTSYFAFWFGIATLLGLALVVDPVDLGVAALLGVPAEIALGVLLLGVVAASVDLDRPGAAQPHVSRLVDPRSLAADRRRAGRGRIVRYRGVGRRPLCAPASRGPARPPLFPRDLCRRADARHAQPRAWRARRLRSDDHSGDRPRSQCRGDRGARPLPRRLLRPAVRGGARRPRWLRGRAAAAHS